MSAHRVVLFGNSGSGKTTLARQLSSTYGIPHLDLDSLAWATPGVRKELKASVAELAEFVNAHEEWVVEGCYGDLIEAALPFCTEIHFLNPGVEACIRNCRNRPWESHKYESLEAQNAMLEYLLEWVRQYETRTDEFSLARHRILFVSFPGSKWEH